MGKAICEDTIMGWHVRNGRFVSSNVNITVEDDEGRKVSVPIGERYRKFTTKLYVCVVWIHLLIPARGRKVTAFGVLFDCESEAGL
jgi:hypothetical protein